MAKVFNVRRGEWGKLLSFASIAMVLQSGLAFGIGAADSIFLAELGPENLPVIYVALPVLMAIYIPLIAWLQARMEARKVLMFVMSALALGGAALGWLMLEGGAPAWAIFAAKLFCALWYVGLYTLMWNFIDSYFDISEGKRLYGIINAGASIGAIVAGTLLSTLSAYLPVGAFFYIWAGLSASLVPLVLLVTRRHLNIDLRQDAAAGAGAISVLASTLRKMKGSTFALLLTAFYAALPLLSATVEYLSMSVFSTFGDQQVLAGLFGKLYVAANLINLGVSLFLFDKLVKTMGVRNIVLIQPIAYLGVFLLFAYPLEVPAAFLGFFAYQALLTSVDNNNANFLFNALPRVAKNQIRTVIEGVGEPLALAFAGGCLLFLATRVGHHTLAVGASAGAVLVLLIAFSINRTYLKGVTANLGSSASHHLAIDEATLDATEEESLLGRTDSADPEEALLALSILARSNPTAAAERFGRWFQLAGGRLGDEGRAVLRRIIDRGGPDAARKVGNWGKLAGLPFDAYPWFELCRAGHGNALPMAVHSFDGSTAVPALKLAARNRGRQGGIAAADLETLRTWLDNGEAEARWAVWALSAIAEPSTAQLLVPLLDSPGLRSSVLEGLEAVAVPGMKSVAARVAGMLPESTPAETLLIFRILKKVGDPAGIAFILEDSIRMTPAEKRNAIDVILHTGPRCIPVLVAAVSSTEYSFSTRSLALRALSLVAPAQVELHWQEIVEKQVRDAALQMESAQRLSTAPGGSAGVAVLQHYHEDAVRRSLLWILEVLAAVNIVQDQAGIATGLMSLHPKERANAIEGIEEAVGPQLFGRLAPLLDYFLGRQEVAGAMAAQEGLGGELEHSASAGALVARQAVLQVISDTTEAPAGVLRRALEHSPAGAAAVLAAVQPIDGGLSEVQLVALVARSRMFDGLSVQELSLIAPHFHRLHPEALERYCVPGIVPPGILLVAGGSLTLRTSSGRVASVGEGTVCFLEALAQRKARFWIADDEPAALVYEIDPAILQRFFQVFPEWGLHLAQFMMTDTEQ